MKDIPGSLEAHKKKDQYREVHFSELVFLLL